MNWDRFGLDGSSSGKRFRAPLSVDNWQMGGDKGCSGGDNLWQNSFLHKEERMEHNEETRQGLLSL